MNILIIGSGGREHALCWKIKQSPILQQLYVLPGSDAIAQIAQCINIAIDDHDEIIQFAQINKIDLVVIGPEIPLVAGLVDKLQKHHIKAFGPSQQASMLEGSKGFMRDFCQEFSIPGAKYARFSCGDNAKTYIKNQSFPIVIKQDGLAAGKGVVIAQNYLEACVVIDQFLNQNDTQQNKIVIEEFLQGEEISFFCICDGKTAIPFGHAQDHKRLLDGDKGPNTGGMGTYAPSPLVTPALNQQIMSEIILPTMHGMQKRGTPFQGILYAGLMLTETGPKLIEYNTRFGDPECQVLMRNLKDDLLPWLLAASQCQLAQISSLPQWYDQAAICVVMVSKDYPNAPIKGEIIHGLDIANAQKNIIVFHAGTKQNAQGNFISHGGRVLNVTAIGQDLSIAQKQAYAAVNNIHWPQVFWRKDIGWRALQINKILCLDS